MIDSRYYAAVVKEELETDDEKVGRPKIKTVTYNYIVRAGSIEAAYTKVQKYMEPSYTVWRIHSVKEMKIAYIIE